MCSHGLGLLGRVPGGRPPINPDQLSGSLEGGGLLSGGAPFRRMDLAVVNRSFILFVSAGTKFAVLRK
jgi:hypothetical protein